MTLILDATEILSDPVVRSRIYKLLALGFKYPTREAFDLYRSGQDLSELLSHISSLPHLSSIAREEARLANKVSEDLEGITFEDFETTYVGSFDVGFPEPPCPPYEGVYSSVMPRTEVMLEVGAFYTHFGLAMSQDEGRLWSLVAPPALVADSCLLVMGSEGKGMRRLIAESCDFLVKIPMRGHVENLNVSVAAGVCLFEVVRQRRGKTSQPGP